MPRLQGMPLPYLSLWKIDAAASCTVYFFNTREADGRLPFIDCINILLRKKLAVIALARKQDIVSVHISHIAAVCYITLHVMDLLAFVYALIVIPKVSSFLYTIRQYPAGIT